MPWKWMDNLMSLFVRQVLAGCTFGATHSFDVLLNKRITVSGLWPQPFALHWRKWTLANTHIYWQWGKVLRTTHLSLNTVKKLMKGFLTYFGVTNEIQFMSVGFLFHSSDRSERQFITNTRKEGHFKKCTNYAYCVDFWQTTSMQGMLQINHFQNSCQ